MTDEAKDALRTPMGREVLLTEHDKRIDSLEARMTQQEGKEVSRDKRWDWAFRSILTIGGGAIVAIISALFATGAIKL